MFIFIFRKLDKDKKSVFSIVKTFVHNNYTTSEDKNVDELKTKFLALFETINFYSGDQKQSLTRKLVKVIYLI